ncbi:WD repeat-containing protein 43-like [Dorcoceras hygrometricum]|uniref:WD repeat-containing protein 43-like n=1 Tax=Dorcoceras hygrometricum TaxID=472368 RepID=A0A2Z7CVA2_9LAMI|nr:WD repeat-containing protein 43-like [Dorcoceras hygrometricum]
MGSSHIRDILTAFSPSLDFFALSLGDGRIKIWDTGKGQVQTEFANIASAESTGIFGKHERGHLSMDYTCMKWLSLEIKKKRKLGSSLLILGTGTGDVLALDVSAGQVKWSINNCHPGGVNAISFPANGSIIYAAGVDGMVCEINSMSGDLLGKFSAMSRSISSLSVSPDGKMVATAAAQLKIFNSSDCKKLQRFSGHPGPVRCMVFSEDGKYVLSSAMGERYVAIWRIDGSKEKSAYLFLAMDHPAVFLDCRCSSCGDEDDTGLSVLAISEMGVCYFWHANTMDELRNSKATKICIPCDEGQKPKGEVSVFAAKLKSGTDINLNISHDGILLPITQSQKSKKASDMHNRVTALDRSNAEGALRPMPKVFDPVDGKFGAKPVEQKGKEFDSVSLCMEDQLKTLGILGNSDDSLSSILNSSMLKAIDLEANTPYKKMKTAILLMGPNDAINLLKALIDLWQSRYKSGAHVLPWIRCLLIYHGDHVKSQEPKLLDNLNKLTKSKGAAMNALFQLSGRLQLVLAQIDKATSNKSLVVEHNEQDDATEDESIDEVLYDVDEDSHSSSENDD